MAAVLEPYDTPMFDYHPDTDVQMHTNSDPWFSEETIMEEEPNFTATRSSSDGDLVDVEIEMENPEYEMLDEEYSAQAGPEDAIVVDASQIQELQTEMTAEPPTVESGEAVVTEPLGFPSTHPSNSISEAQGTESETEPAVTTTVFEEPLSAHVPADESYSHVEESSLEDSSAVSYPEGDSSESTAREQIQPEEPGEPGVLHPQEQAAETAQVSAGSAHEFETTGSGVGDEGTVTGAAVGTVEPDTAETSTVEASTAAAGTAEPDTTENGTVEASTTEAGSVETGTDDQPQAETGEEQNDPHEISEGVYIDPPPAVLLSFAFLEHPDVCLFNLPSHSDASSSTTEPTNYAVLLSDQPTLYYEPLSSVFDALRNDSELSNVTDLSYVELVLDAYDLQLTISEDNVFARETSIHDLNVLHDGSGFSGSLRLRLQLVSPRFIVRYRMLQEQIHRLNLVSNEEYTAEELNVNSLQEISEREHGPDLAEENEEDYAQEQDEEKPIENNTHQENDSGETEADPSDEGDDRTPLDGGNGQRDSARTVQDPEGDDDEDGEVTASYDDSQEFDGNDEQKQETENENHQVDTSLPAVEISEGHDIPNDDQEPEDSAEGREEDQDNSQSTNDESQAQEELYKPEDEKVNGTTDDAESSTVPKPLSESHIAESRNVEESYQEEDLYYDENADAEWEGTEYEEDAVEGVEEADTTFADVEADHESASVESSVTLSSQHSKRSIQAVDDEGDNDEELIFNSPASKRARTE